MEPWKRRFLLETIIFRGELLVLGRVDLVPFGCQSPKHPKNYDLPEMLLDFVIVKVSSVKGRTVLNDPPQHGLILRRHGSSKMCCPGHELEDKKRGLDLQQKEADSVTFKMLRDSGTYLQVLPVKKLKGVHLSPKVPGTKNGGSVPYKAV